MKKKASALIFSCVICVFLGLMGIGFLAHSIVEQRSSESYAEGIRAFWAAEAGAARAFANLRTNPAWNPAALTTQEKTVSSDANFTVAVTTPATALYRRQVTVTGTVAGYRNFQRTISFSLDYPPLFHNAVSVGGRLRRLAILAALDINGHTEVGNGAQIWVPFFNWVPSTGWIFTDAAYTYDWGANPDPKIIYPDGPTDVDTAADDFSDFKDYNQDVINTYAPEEVIYVDTNSDVVIWPGWDGQGKVIVGGSVLNDDGGNPVTLSGKKILYVEGDSAGDGDVDIWFGGAETFNNGEDLTIISTGTVTYLEPLQTGDNDSRLNVIAWDDYDEAGILFTNHNLNVYSHDNINYLALLSLSSTEGVCIANDDLTLTAGLALKMINFPANVEAPPGFEGFSGMASGNIFSAGTIATRNKDWQEL